MSESQTMKDGWTAMVAAGAKLFRNNIGSAVTGKMIRQGSTVTVYAASMIKFGLCVGSSDLIGYQTVTVTPEMVGRKLAVFVAAEAKTEDGRVSPEQIQFISTVRADGGIAFIFRSPGEAVDLLKQESMI